MAMIEHFDYVAPPASKPSQHTPMKDGHTSMKL